VDDEEMSEVPDTVTIVLIKLKTLRPDGFGQQFQLLVPEGFGQQTFRRLNYSGCKAVGLREYLAINLEC